MASTVEVRLELGHKAKVRDVPSPEGHTHDWEVFVKGTDGIRLEHFVEKVVFWLHESYEPPGRVIKHPPYKVKESGFAGFNMLIDVHFRNKEEPKTVRFQYDLFLHTESMPPVNHTRLEKLTFTNPTEDFRKKLLSAGAVLVNASSGSRHSSKDRSSRTVSPSSKKESSKSRDGSKHRESGSSSNKLHGDRKRSSSHSKKDGRIPTKDMKKHDENFKLPKNPNSSEKKSKEEVGERSETNYHERGRPEKRRSAAGDEDGNKKKKKKHSDEPPQRPKSLNVSSGSTSSNTQKKDKEKVRRIKEKPDLMAGLFAPENSINMTQIKQSKEKAKQEDLKIKKEKSSMSTPSRNSPHPSQEETSVVHSAKISPAGNLTLKIKREKIPSTEKEKKVKESSANQISNSKRRESVDKEKKRSKESSSKTRIPERKPEPKRTPVVSSDSSLSGSDMDISDLESSADENLTEKIKVHVPKVEEKVKSKSKPDNSVNRDSPKRKLEKKNSTPVMVKQESKVKSENRSFKESPSQSKPAIKKEKSRRDSVTTKEKSEKVSTKHKKSGKDKDKDHSERESTPSSKPKKHKRSSKEKVLAKQPSKDVQRSSPPEKEKALSSTPNTERIAPKKKSTDYPSPSLKSHEASSPATVSKPKKASVSPKPTSRPNKSPKPANVPPIKKEKDINIRKEIHKKPPSVPSKKTSSKNSSKHEEKSKPVFKSRSFVETSSDDSEESDDEIPPPLAHKVIPKKISPIRKDSISSQSSAVSDNHSMTSDDEKHHVPHQHPQALPHSSSSSDSSDEELNMSGLPLENTANLSVISPIRESNSHIENTIDATTAYQDMEMSDSSDDSPFHEPNIEEEKHPTQGNELENLVPTEDNNHENREKGFRDLGLSNDFDTSSDEESDAPVEKPFQNQEEYAGSPGETENLHQDEQGPSTDLPDVITKVGSVGNYPEMNDTLYQELQELQKKISYITDVERLRKIATIVAKSQKLVKNDEYFDFDLCSLDHRTINKIQKQLKAI